MKPKPFFRDISPDGYEPVLLMLDEDDDGNPTIQIHFLVDEDIRGTMTYSFPTPEAALNALTTITYKEVSKSIYLLRDMVHNPEEALANE